MRNADVGGNVAALELARAAGTDPGAKEASAAPKRVAARIAQRPRSRAKVSAAQ